MNRMGRKDGDTPEFKTLGATTQDKSGKILMRCDYPYQPKAEYGAAMNYAFDGRTPEKSEKETA